MTVGGRCRWKPVNLRLRRNIARGKRIDSNDGSGRVEERISADDGCIDQHRGGAGNPRQGAELSQVEAESRRAKAHERAALCQYQEVQQSLLL